MKKDIYDAHEFTALPIPEQIQRSRLGLLLKQQESVQPTLRDQFAMACTITMQFFIEAHYDELKGLPSHEVLYRYCQMRFSYADAMMKARIEGE